MIGVTLMRQTGRRVVSNEARLNALPRVGDRLSLRGSADSDVWRGSVTAVEHTLSGWLSVRGVKYGAQEIIVHVEEDG